MLKYLLLMALCAATTHVATVHAAPRQAPFDVKDEEAKLDGKKLSVSIHYFSVQSPLASVAKLVNAKVYEATGFAANKRAWQTHEHDDLEVLGRCVPSLLTHSVVSFRCGVVEVPIFTIEPNSGGAPGGTYEWTTYNFRIVGLELVPITLASLFGTTSAALDVIAKATKQRWSEDRAAQFVISEDGLAFYDWDEGASGEMRAPVLELPLAALAPHLAPGHPWLGLAPDDAESPEGAPPPRALIDGPRFEARGEVVYDRATKLTWAANDNGADLDQSAARGYCDALVLGGRDDWRLPAIDQLDLLSDVASRHKPDAARDCVQARYAYAIDAAFHLSCGILWSADVQGSAAASLGFVSGKRRSDKLTATKNLRALCVRAP